MGKKLLLLIILLLTCFLCSSCSNDEPNPEYDITELYALDMRGRALAYPFKAYIFRLSDQQYVYAYRNDIDMDLHVGDHITGFKTHPTCSNNLTRVEISSRGTGEALTDQYQGYKFSDFLLASSPYEDVIAKVIRIKILDAATLPIDNYVIITQNNHIIYGKAALIGFVPQTGQRIVYSVFLAYKSEINEIKLLS